MARTLTDEDVNAVAARVIELLAIANVHRAQIGPDAIYTVPEAATLLKCCRDTIRRYLRAGIIRGRRTGGGVYRIRGSELLKLT